MSNRSAASESKASAVTQPNRFEAQAQAHSRLPTLARRCLLQAHPSRIDGTSLFYIRISGLRIRQNGASLVFFFCSHDSLTRRSQPCFVVLSGKTL